MHFQFGTPGTARIVVDERLGVIVGATFTGTDVADWLYAATIAIVSKTPVELLVGRSRLPLSQRDLAEAARDPRGRPLPRRALSPPATHRQEPLAAQP